MGLQKGKRPKPGRAHFESCNHISDVKGLDDFALSVSLTAKYSLFVCSHFLSPWQTSPQLWHLQHHGIINRTQILPSHPHTVASWGLHARIPLPHAWPQQPSLTAGEDSTTPLLIVLPETKARTTWLKLPCLAMCLDWSLEPL